MYLSIRTTLDSMPRPEIYMYMCVYVSVSHFLSFGWHYVQFYLEKLQVK